MGFVWLPLQRAPNRSGRERDGSPQLGCSGPENSKNRVSDRSGQETGGSPQFGCFRRLFSPAVCVATSCRSLISLVVGLIILVVGSEPSRVDNVLLSCT